MATNISCLWLLLATAVVIQAASIHQEGASTAGVEDSGDFITNGVKFMYRIYQQCDSESDLVSCLKLRALRFSDRALSQSSIPVIDGLTLVNSANKEGRSNNMIEEVDETALPQDPEQRQDKLDELLVDRLGRFLSSFTVQMSVPKYAEEPDSDENSIGNGRKGGGGGGGKKAIGPLLLLGAMMKGGLLAMGLKGLALLAGKALLVAKIALVLSVIVALSKLANGGHEKTTYEIVKHPHISHGYSHSSSVVHGGGDYGGGHYETSGGGWGRSYQPTQPEDAQTLAYRAHQPVKA